MCMTSSSGREEISEEEKKIGRLWGVTSLESTQANSPSAAGIVELEKRSEFFSAQ